MKFQFLIGAMRHESKIPGVSISLVSIPYRCNETCAEKRREDYEIRFQFLIGAMRPQRSRCSSPNNTRFQFLIGAMRLRNDSSI